MGDSDCALDRVRLALLAAGLLAVGGFCMRPPAPPAPPNLETAPLAFAGAQACEACHPYGDEFKKTSHARTLTRTEGAAEPAGMNGSSFADGRSGLKVLFDARRGCLQASVAGSSEAEPLPMEWRFGSGAQGFTFVSTWDGPTGATEGLEFRWSWYSKDACWDYTIGQSGSSASLIGDVKDLPALQSCFGCHSTDVPVSARRLNFDRLEAGVFCEACHGPGADHVESAKLGRPKQGVANPANLSGRAQLELCGRCHRTEKDAGEIAERPLVRFQGIGFARSKCFLAESEKPSPFVCTTCHDPHAVDVDLAKKTLAKCLSCHGPSGLHCAVEPAGDRCLLCHMPAVKTGAHVEHHDHWIRKNNPFATAKK